MKVEQFYHTNQFIIRGGASVIFQSYQSTIAEIKNNNLTLFNKWDYSHTTLKHLYLFLEEYDVLLNDDLKNILRDLSYSKNKRKFIQNLIDIKKIKYKVI